MGHYALPIQLHHRLTPRTTPPCVPPPLPPARLQVRACVGVSAPSQQTLWGLVGLKACAFSPAMPVGEYAITYSAEDSMGAMATVVRRLVVLQPCPDGEVREKGGGGAGCDHISTRCLLIRVSHRM